MAPREKLETKQTLTAVLLADSFTQRFRPITVERPKALLPLVNAPMIEYALEWLAMNRVEEIFVFCCAHADQVKRHIAESKWAKQRSPRVVTVVARNCLSAGEALRALDQKDIIKGDFVLLSADTVSNLDLAPALAAHRARREKDKNAIMTMIMKRAADPCQRARLGDLPLTVAVDPACGRLLRYLEGGGGGGKGAGGAGGSVKIDAALYGEREGVQVRSDLLDSHIAICAPEVLMLFSDNFDYQHVARDFVAGVLSEEELGNKVYLHVVEREYAARVHNLRAYDAVSRDLLGRWAFPFAPDANAFARGGAWGPSSYRFARGGRYLEATAAIARGAAIGEATAVGAGAAVGDGTSVSHSVVGRGCRIGRNCTLRGAYLMDDVTIGDNCTVTFSLLCEKVTLLPGATVGPGSVLSYNVVVGARHTVPPGARVSLCRSSAGAHGAAAGSDDETEYASTAARRRSSGAGGGGGRRGSRAGGGGGGGAQSDDDDSGSGWDSDDDGGSGGGLSGCSAEKPTPAATAAADAAKRGAPLPPPGAPGAPDFEAACVGAGGAGYLWPVAASAGNGSGGVAAAREAAMNSLAPPPTSGDAYGGYGGGGGEDDDEPSASVAGEGGGGGGAGGGAAGGAAGGKAGASARGGGAESGSGSDDDDDDDSGSERGGGGSGSGSDNESGARGGGGGGAMDPEVHFCCEVAETYLRCVQMRFDQSNAVIELNGLKIAEDRTFADCARYVLTAMLGLCAPAGRRVAAEYRKLYPQDAPDVSTNAGKLLLIKRLRARLAEWAPLLRRFLKSEDDQVELLLTLEEYCAGEGVFEGAGEPAGPLFSAVFAQLLQQLYDADVVDEPAFEAWASEKAEADADERVYLDKARPFLDWLATADEDEDEEEGSDE